VIFFGGQNSGNRFMEIAGMTTNMPQLVDLFFWPESPAVVGPGVHPQGSGRR